jgi:hypothetical protein
MELDSFGLSMKDLATKNVITRCNSSGPLYTIRLLAMHPPQASTHYAHTSVVGSTSLWHHHLGHPGLDALLKLSHHLMPHSVLI